MPLRLENAIPIPPKYPNGREGGPYSLMLRRLDPEHFIVADNDKERRGMLRAAKKMRLAIVTRKLDKGRGYGIWLLPKTPVR